MMLFVSEGLMRRTTDLTHPARAKNSQVRGRYALEATVIDHLPISRTATKLVVSWHIANVVILNAGRRLVINGSLPFEGVTELGMNVLRWRQTLPARSTRPL